ncbi:hypothetical protein [Kribbella italica]|uniref:Uncharacterized protein n=1 Tax=Kribbella italica TaxID=1540520 RepID=A0A7W9J251_9ACTN|nr:hypothetical protein [Kribbella italica]MBB5833975.1 hypothetical protein [Kribbella italica]
MRVLAILALGTTLLAAPLTAQAAPGTPADAAPQAVAAAWPSCVKVVRTKLNNDGWNDYKWVVDVTNKCSSGISYNVTRNGSSDYGYRDVAAGKSGSTYTGKLSFGHDASKPDGVKMYYKGTKYTKTF